MWNTKMNSYAIYRMVTFFNDLEWPLTYISRVRHFQAVRRIWYYVLTILSRTVICTSHLQRVFSKFSTAQSIARPVCDSWASCCVFVKGDRGSEGSPGLPGIDGLPGIAGPQVCISNKWNIWIQWTIRYVVPKTIFRKDSDDDNPRYDHCESYRVAQKVRPLWLLTSLKRFDQRI